MAMKGLGRQSGFQPYRSPSSNETAASSSSSPPPHCNDLDQTGVSDNDVGDSATDKGDWNVCYLYLHGLDFDKNLENCPKTAAAIR